MKALKICAIATMVTAIIMLSCAFALSAGAEEYGEFYPRLTVVVSIDNVPNESRIYCQDKNGNIWSFYSDDTTWVKGDIVNLLMWNNSDDITEHEIIEVYLEGHTENIELFFEINGWE